MAEGIALAQTKARNSRIFERHAEDWYVEPAWVWHRLFDRFDFAPGADVLDPACGCGTSVEAATVHGLSAHGSDIVPRWRQKHEAVGVFEERDCFDAMRGGAEVIVSNPPFKIAREFAQAAIEVAEYVCLLLPATWGCGDAKARWLSTTPLSNVLFLTPRPSMLPGENVLRGETAGGGTKDYAIFVWQRGRKGAAEVGWLHRDGAVA